MAFHIDLSHYIKASLLGLWYCEMDWSYLLRSHAICQITWRNSFRPFRWKGNRLILDFQSRRCCRYGIQSSMGRRLHQQLLYSMHNNLILSKNCPYDRLIGSRARKAMDQCCVSNTIHTSARLKLIYSFFLHVRVSWNHEMYCAGHLLEAAIAHNDYVRSNNASRMMSSGDPDELALLWPLLRYVKHINRIFGTEENQRHGCVRY